MLVVFVIYSFIVNKLFMLVRDMVDTDVLKYTFVWNIIVLQSTTIYTFLRGQRKREILVKTHMDMGRICKTPPKQ